MHLGAQQSSPNSIEADTKKNRRVVRVLNCGNAPLFLYYYWLLPTFRYAASTRREKAELAVASSATSFPRRKIRKHIFTYFYCTQNGVQESLTRSKKCNVIDNFSNELRKLSSSTPMRVQKRIIVKIIRVTVELEILCNTILSSPKDLTCYCITITLHQYRLRSFGWPMPFDEF